MGKYFRLGLIGAFLLQAGLLSWLIIDRALLIRNGKEIQLAVVPVDPRDLLRGDYVILSYPISRLMSDEIAGDDMLYYGDTVYVTMASGPDGWRATAMSRMRPDSGTFLRGTVADSAYDLQICKVKSPCNAINVRYDLEQFFVPEGEGRDLENLRNNQRMTVDVAVADNGKAALKRLRVDGEVRYEEELY